MEKNSKLKNQGFTIFSDTTEKKTRSRNNDYENNDNSRLNMSNFKPEKASFRHEIREQNLSFYLSSSNSTNGSSFSRNVTDNN